MSGRNHTEQTRKKMSEAGKQIDHSGRFKPGENHPKSQVIEVTEIKSNTTTHYGSVREAARALNIPHQAVSNYFIRNQQKPYKGQYTFKKL